jgi:hypothetical protein
MTAAIELLCELLVRLGLGLFLFAGAIVFAMVVSSREKFLNSSIKTSENFDEH